MQMFLDYLQSQQNRIHDIMEDGTKPMKWDERAKERASAQHNCCYICSKKLRYSYERYRDHDHLSGEFRGIACLVCNLKHTSDHNMKIYVIMHNASGYDLHFLVRELHHINQKVSIIPRNTERFLAMQIGDFLFIDSFQFLSESLSTLADNLRSMSKEAFTFTTKYVPDPQKSELLLRKGVFCYSYLDSIHKFEERKLPEIHKFYNDLDQSHISEGNYMHARTVWTTFNCQSLGEYHDVYLQSDLLILADVFENFRGLCLNFYQLDPAHYFSSPQLSFDALLKTTRVKLELFSDPDMYSFIEKGIRGGVAGIIQRFSKANNRHMRDYDREDESSYLWYIDMNSLYASVMQEQRLPLNGFQWLTRKEIHNIDISSMHDDDDVGFILEVTMNYPEKLHDIQAHRDFPLAVEKIPVLPNELSPLTEKMKQFFGIKTSKGVTKLIPSLNRKEKYVLHYQNLKLYLELGLELVQVHRAIKFQQRKWMAPYMKFNAEQRKQALTPFQSMFFKTMSNSVFGKSLEDMKKRTNVKLVSSPAAFERLSSKSTFRGCKIIHDNLASVHMSKAVIMLDRPIYLGFSILDLAKFKMYFFHYKYIAEKYGPRAKLVFTDTDSFIYHIFTRDLYRDIGRERHLFDFSTYPKSHPLHSEINRRKPGVMKDESCGSILREFVGLGTKMYSVQHVEDHSDSDAKKAKGVQKSIIQKLDHTDYRNCLFNMQRMEHSFYAIRSFSHQLYTVKQRKYTLSCYDDKRYLLDCNIHSLPYGHYSLKRCCDDSTNSQKKRKRTECTDCAAQKPL